MQRADQLEFTEASIAIQQQVEALHREAASWSESDPAYAVSLLEKALRLSGTVDGGAPADPLGLAYSLLHFARLQLRLANYDRALAYSLNARSLFSSLGCPDQCTACTGCAGLAFLRLGSYQQAFECLYQALDEAQKAGDAPFAAEMQFELGLAYTGMGRAAEGLGYLLEAASIFRKLNDRKRLGRALGGLCQAHAQLGDYARALEAGQESVRVAEALEAWKDLSGSLQALGQVYLAQGEAAPALECQRRSLNIAQKHGFREDAAAALQAIALILSRQGRLDLALVSLQDALAAAEQIGSKPLQMGCNRGLVEVFKLRGDFKAALECQEKLQSLQAALFDEGADRRIKELEVLRGVEAARRKTEALRLKNAELQKELDERKQAQARLELLANTDPLTGIINRRCFFNLAAVQLDRSRRLDRPLSLIMFDLDRFKVINDTYGHMAGDEVLVEIARRVQGEVRRADILARFGGEEFVVLLPETGIETARLSAERLRRRIAVTPISIAVATLSITISLGVAHFHGQGALSLESLLDRADRALYEAKETGRNRVAVYREKPFV